MLLACEKDSTVFNMLSEELQTDQAIVEAVVAGEGYSSLRTLPHTTQCLYPNLVIRALGDCRDDYDYEDLYESDGTVVVDALWSNIEVVRAWFKSRGPVHSRFPVSMKNDVAFGLAVASAFAQDDDDADYEWYDMRISEFQVNTSVELRKNKEFMMEAVALYGVLLFAADDSLRRDEDLAIVAYSSKQDLIGFQFYDGHEDDIEEHNNDVEFLKSVCARLLVRKSTTTKDS